MRRIVCVAAVAAAALPAAALAESTPDQTNKQNAAQQCKQLRAGLDRAQFASMLTTTLGVTGVNHNGRNAYGKCVSHFARADARQEAKAKSSAVADCRAEGKTKRDFGKCVSARSEQEKADADRSDMTRAKTLSSAAKRCRQPGALDAYGTKRNAFGKCVAATAKQIKAERTQTAS